MNIMVNNLEFLEKIAIQFKELAEIYNEVNYIFIR